MATYSWHSLLSKARQSHDDSVRKSKSLGPVPELSSRAGKLGPEGDSSEEVGKRQTLRQRLRVKLSRQDLQGPKEDGLLCRDPRRGLQSRQHGKLKLPQTEAQADS